ncbi:MAG: ArnT family glycosyltransferase [Endomicrobiia bacterium]
MIEIIWLLLFIMAVFIIGDTILRPFSLNNISFCEKFILCEGIGWGVFSFLTLGMGFLGILEKIIFQIIIIVLSILGVTIFIKKFRFFQLYSSENFRNKIYIFLLVLGSISIFSYLLSCYLPILESDVLIYHLAIPKRFIDEGKIFNISRWFKYATFPQLAEMLYLSALIVSNETLANFIHTFFGILSFLLIYIIGKNFVDIKTGFVAAIIFLILPVVKELSGTAMVDLALNFYFLLVIFSCLKWVETKNNKWFYLSGIFYGLSFSVKYTGILALYLVIFTILWFKLMKDTSTKIFLKDTMIFFTIFIVISLPWLLRNYLWTKNPFSPFFYHIFGGSNWNEYLQADLINHFRNCKKPFLKYLWDFVGENGDIFVLFAIFMPFLRMSLNIKFFFVCGVIYMFISIFFLPSIIRFMLPGMSILVICVGYAFLQILENKEIFHLKYLRTFFLIWFLSSVSYKTLLVVQKITLHNNLKVLVGIESKESYLRRKIEYYDVVEYVNNNLSKNDTILSINESRSYYFNPKFLVSYHTLLGSVVHTSQDIEYIIEHLIKHKIYYLFTNRSNYYINSQRRTLLTEKWVLERYFSLVYTNGICYLYRVKSKYD